MTLGPTDLESPKASGPHWPRVSTDLGSLLTLGHWPLVPDVLLFCPVECVMCPAGYNTIKLRLVLPKGGSRSVFIQGYEHR